MTTLLVAISGGHLTQLTMLAPRIVDGDDVIWLTDDTAQSRSLLAGQTVYHVPTRRPRDYAGVMRDTRIAHRVLRRHRVDRVISTGAQIALTALVPASAERVPFTYIESATRVTGVSATGKVMERVPWVERFVQYPHAVNQKWKYALSVFDGFRVEPIDNPNPIRRAVVTVGGNGEYGFRRLIDSVRAALSDLDADVETLWQVGATDVSDLPISAVSSLPSRDLDQAMREADLVIGHSGTGTALAALAAGRVPVLSPRSVEHGEHVDAHQRDLARFLRDRGLAVVCEAPEIRPSTLVTAHGWRSVRSDDLTPVSL